MARGKKKTKELTIEEKLQAADLRSLGRLRLPSLVPAEEQPYKVPENWRYIFLNGVTLRIKRGKYPKYVDSSNILVFAQKCNQKDGTIAMIKAQFLNPDMATKLSDEEFLHDNDVVINSTGTGTLGRVGFYKEEYSLPYRKVLPDSHVTVVRALPNVNSRYTYYYLKSKQEYLELQGVGSTNQKELRPDVIGAIKFPLPPLPEQQRIVDRIESLFAKLDEAKEKAQAVIDGYELRKSAILHKAFAGDLTKKWRENHGIGLENWNNVELGECLLSMETRKPAGEYFRYIDIDAIDNKRQEVKSPKVTETAKAPSRASRAVEAGNVLFSMVRPYLKNIALVDETMNDCIASTGFYVCRCKTNILPVFLYQFLCSKDAIDYLMQFMKGDNSPSIRKNDLLNMKIKLPSIDEQEELCKIINSLNDKEQQAKEAAETVISQIDTMKKAILARAFRGELGTNNPAEESSIELLKQIL